MMNVPPKGILVFEDKGKKFIGEQHGLKNLINDCDIKVGTQDKNGKPVALTVEVSEAGTLDRDTFERKKETPVVCEKMNYEKTSPLNLFDKVLNLTYVLGSNKRKGINEQYMIDKGLYPETITESEYKNIDYIV